MKAIIYQKYGQPDVLHVAEVAKPTPKDNELLIRVHAVEVTKADCEMRSFRFPVKWFWLPLRLALGVFRPRRQILGGYFAGEIENVGAGVTKFKPGNQVYGGTGLRFGAYGEYLCLPETSTVLSKPENMSFEQAAVVPLGGLNALHYMSMANIQPGEKVLINGAGGSIGTFAVQISKQMGAEVTAVDSAIKQDMIRQIGADHFFDYAKGHFSQTGQRYDVIFDMVAQKSYSKCIDALNSGGRYLMGNPRFVDMLRSVITSNRTDKVVKFAFAPEKIDELEDLKQRIEEGSLKSIIDHVYPMEQASQAHQKVETEKRIGCVVIDMHPEPTCA